MFHEKGKDLDLGRKWEEKLQEIEQEHTGEKLLASLGSTIARLEHHKTSVVISTHLCSSNCWKGESSVLSFK
jgi:hypothetical protein